MKYSKNYFLIMLIPLLFTFCSKSDDEFGEHGSITIEFGSVCGWCVGEEKIIVSSVKTDYYKNIPCGENKGTINKTDAITSDEWEEIFSSFDYNDFLELEYDECNVCADGCDEFIIIIKNESSHEIRYTPSKEIEGLEELRQLLNNKLEELKNSD
ncbi:hypothetical protein GM418_09030 [Maribellus comscasis]|uniref:Uncharacterized protein n=1 Tax=Maribellus comscasis TaxID=2681766 RepID=A0A6I6JUE7_9BACT|nr:hypothetical protein [Maribellus comscasis]QGY43797.1 hypothetical protein GM418_09030 [Maribellus comscasis]